MIGYLRCRDCGSKMNAAEQAVRDGNADRAATAAEQVRSYQQAEGVRLRDVADAYRVH